MDIIRAKGLEYGLEFNEKKLEMMVVNGDDPIFAVDGTAIKQKDLMLYLRSIISKDGRMQAELSRRNGCASQTFNELERLWKHANISNIRNIKVFESCVVSRLLYALETY